MSTFGNIFGQTLHNVANPPQQNLGLGQIFLSAQRNKQQKELQNLQADQIREKQKVATQLGQQQQQFQQGIQDLTSPQGGQTLPQALETLAPQFPQQALELLGQTSQIDQRQQQGATAQANQVRQDLPKIDDNVNQALIESGINTPEQRTAVFQNPEAREQILTRAEGIRQTRLQEDITKRIAGRSVSTVNVGTGDNQSIDASNAKELRKGIIGGESTLANMGKILAELEPIQTFSAERFAKIPIAKAKDFFGVSSPGDIRNIKTAGRARTRSLATVQNYVKSQSGATVTDNEREQFGKIIGDIENGTFNEAKTAMNTFIEIVTDRNKLGARLLQDPKVGGGLDLEAIATTGRIPAKQPQAPAAQSAQGLAAQTQGARDGGRDTMARLQQIKQQNPNLPSIERFRILVREGLFRPDVFERRFGEAP